MKDKELLLLKTKVEILWEILGCYCPNNQTSTTKTIQYHEPELDSDGITLATGFQSISTEQYEILTGKK